jgi:hypothetical protein
MPVTAELADPALEGYIFRDENDLADAGDIKRGLTAVKIYEKVRRPAGTFTVCALCLSLDEQLVMTMRWKSAGLNVNYMPWNQFRESIAQVSEDFTPQLLRDCDYIWGGADFNLDLRLAL